MPNRPLDWDAIQTVTEVARHRTVRAAATVLGIHHTTASRRIEQLENRLGTRLFDRRPDGFMLTEAGETLVRLGRQFADDLMEARRYLDGRDDGLSGTVTITMAEPLFTDLFASRLPELVAAHPDLVPQFEMSLDTLDLARREADVAIRMDNNPPDTLVGKRLFPYHETAYATPDYLAATTPNRTPERARWLGWRIDEPRFPDWTQPTEFARAPVWGAFPTLGSHGAAARAGLGLALLPCLFGDADDRLVRATTRAPTPSRDIWILTHADLRRTARVRAVMSWAEMVLRDARDEIVGKLPTGA